MPPSTADVNGAPIGSTDRPAARTAAGTDVWERMLVGWHVAFWLMVGVAAVFTVVSTALVTAERWQIGGLLVVLAVAYALGVMMQDPAACRGPSGWAYLVLAIAVVGLACTIEPALTMLLFIVFPQVWMLTPTLRWGMAACTTLAVVAIVGIGVHLDWNDDVLRNVVPQMLVTLLFSILLGFWISRVIEQSSQRAALIAQLQHTRDELASAHHTQGVMAERERMAREIHDTLAQGFTSIVMLSQAAQAGLVKALSQNGSGGSPSTRRELGRLADIEAVARENLAEARALVAAFSPVDLDGSTLADAVRRLTDRFAERTGARVEVEVSGSLTGVSRDQEVVLLRAVQEALANVHRHARARSVLVRLIADEDEARVEVADDGVGFATSEPEGYGLSGMRARVGDVGGQVEVDSAVGRGTRVVVQVPAAQAEAEAS